jgi:hypothetical protein
MQQNSILIINGSAACVDQDLDAIHELIGELPRDYMAIGLDAVDKHYWPIKYMATFHPAELPLIIQRRRDYGGNIDYEVISHEPRETVKHFISDWWKPSGSSALLGVQAAITRLGYKKIILCGCPMTGFNEKNNNYANFQQGWKARLKEVGDNVRSMSGWTMELLGAPTKEWLNQ